MQRLLVSVRGPIEAVEAVKGGAHAADLHKLKKEATSQLKSLMNYKYTYPIESPYGCESTSTFDKNLKGLLEVPPEDKD